MRSASFALGFLQALYRRGVLRQIDFLSTVSGGGYAGTFLSSSILSETESIDWKGDSPSDDLNSSPDADRTSAGKPLCFDADPNGAQPAAVRKLAARGQFFRRPLHFASRWFWGFVVINTVLISGLTAIAALLAWLFRLLDHREVMLYLSQLGYRGDVSRAFFPAACLLILWLITQVLYAILRRVRPRVPEFPTAAFVLFVVSAAMAILALFGTGDISMRSLQVDFGWSDETTQAVDHAIRTFGNVVVGLLLASVLPLFRPDAILRSGTKPKNVVEKWAFSVVSYGVVLGVPAVLFWFMVREDVSNHNEERSDRFAFSDLQIPSSQLKPFWELVRAEHESADGCPTSPAGRLWRATTLPAPSGSNSLGTNDLLTASTSVTSDESDRVNLGVSLIALQSMLDDLDRETWFYQRWARFAFHQLGISDDFRDNLAARRRFRALRHEVYERINRECLSDPDFYTEFAIMESGSETRSASVPAWFTANHRDVRVPSELVTHARQLKYEVKNILGSRVAPLPNQGESLLSRTAAWRKRVRELEARRATVGELREREFFERLHVAIGHRDRLESALTSVREANWALLESYYGSKGIRFKSPSVVFALVVNEADQETRLTIGLVSLAVFLAVGLTVPVNPTSLHDFYRTQLAKVWIRKHPRYGRRIGLADFDTCAKGGPYHLLNGTLNLFARRQDRDAEPMDGYIFSRRFCGADRIGYHSAGPDLGRKFDVANAMAISGGALSPHQTDAVLMRALLLVLNMRLGQWLPNPSNMPSGIVWPSMLGLLSRYFLWKPKDWQYCFVSDGGHYENTGIESLLNRRCRVIIACDASQDEEYQFLDFMKLLDRCEWKHDVRITGLCASGDESSLDLESLIPHSMKGEETAETQERPAHGAEVRFSDTHFVVARIVYPDDELSRSAGLLADNVAWDGVVNEESRTGYLIYVKPTLYRDLALKVREYAKRHQEFPNDPTVDQFFSCERFRAYRDLGDHAGESLWRELFQRAASNAAPDSPWLSTWTPAADADSSGDPVDDADAFAGSETDESLRRDLVICRSEDCDPRTRMNAAASVGEAGIVNRHVVDALLNAATSKNRYVRKTAEDAILRLGVRAVEELSAAGLCSPDRNLQVAAAECLEAIFLIAAREGTRPLAPCDLDGASESNVVQVLINLLNRGATVSVRAGAGNALVTYLLWANLVLTPNLVNSIRQAAEQVAIHDASSTVRTIASHIIRALDVDRRASEESTAALISA